ncbi:MAG: class I SAM-dependent rRNA methyltransferase [Kiritimatiellaeota bacterium]|nr:class I SAM-dependent rRNA methyltransferase [Kiritimatiellota bacterium]
MSSYPRIILKQKRDGPVRTGHPWIFSGAISQADEEIVGDGDVVDVCAADGEFLARGALNTDSQVAVRIWTWEKGEAIDREFFRRRIRAACELRESLGIRDGAGTEDSPTAAYRLLHGESDGVPGLVADVYGDIVVLQLLTCGAEKQRAAVAAALRDEFPETTIIERSEGPTRTREGLPPRSDILTGAAPAAPIEISENGSRFLVDVLHGQKTGFYLDQRENRAVVRRFLARTNRAAARETRTVLNLFSYTGAFGIMAGAAAPDIHVLNIDSSAGALELGARNAAINGMDERMEFREGNAFHVLRQFRDARRQFDAIILDPPRFANSAGAVPGACRGYKDLNLLSLKLLRPGGLLFTFSCSGRVDAALFRKVVDSAAADAGRRAQILAQLHQAPDHPVLSTFPEGDYLKGLVLRTTPF